MRSFHIGFNSRHLSWVVFISLICFGILQSTGRANADTEGPLSVARITPTGNSVPDGRQIVIEFDRAVVPLGRMERNADEVPVEITPQVACEWRWLSDRALACQLGEKDSLKLSTRYEMKVNPGLIAKDGTTLSEPLEHSFSTRRIVIDRVAFNDWSGPSSPSFLVTFNQPARRDTVQQNLYFAWTQSGGGRQAVHVNEGPEWSNAPDDSLVSVPREPGIAGFFKRLFAYIPWFRAETTPAPKEWARRAWLVTPIEALPEGTDIEFWSGAGILSNQGDLPSKDERQIKKFATFGAFKFLGIRCENNAGGKIEIPAGTSTASKKDRDLCGPWNTVRLMFSSPLKLQEVKDHIELSPELGKPSPDADAWDGVDLEQTEGHYAWRGHTAKDIYTARFPVRLRADRTYKVGLKEGDDKIVDIFGRPLDGDIIASWQMDNRPPNYELPNRVAVLEKSVDSEVPFYVNNLTKRHFAYSRLTSEGLKNNLVLDEALDPIRNLQYAIPFGVRGMLGGKSGVILGELSTVPEVSRYKPVLFAQVTPFALHAKIGHFNSMVWVTDMATGEPVSGVRVSLYKDPTLFAAFCNSQMPKAWKPGREETYAMTDGNGIAQLPGQPVATGRWDSPCDTAIVVKAQKADDLALMPLYYQFEADTYRASGEQIWPNTQAAQGHMRVWGTTAQGVYKAGDTIQYKIYVRGQENEGLAPAPGSEYRVQLIDPTGKLVAETKDMGLNEFGTTSGEFSISKSGAVGWYRFRLLQKYDKEAGEIEDLSIEEGALNESGWYAWKPMQVLVSDFTPSSFRVTATVDGKVFSPDQTVKLEGRAALHAGGPYTNATARVTAIFDPMSMYSKHPVASKFTFSRSDETPDNHQRLIAQLQQPLNDNGVVEADIKIPEQVGVSFGDLTFEVAVADDRGKTIANAVHATYAATDRFVGLHSTEWIYNAGKPAAYEYIVVDAQGEPVKGTKVDIEILRKNVTAARVKSAGNVYQTVYDTKWEKVGNCSGKPNGQPETCSFTPKNAGEYRMLASVKGSKGKTHTASDDLWVVGRDVVLWEGEPDTALEMFPEQPTYKVGDTARYLVKNPYPNAKALVTVERYGVLDQFTMTFDTSTPIVEIPVKPEYAPGFYVSIVLMSPRVDKPLEANMVDLGKPAFRMGYVAVPVSDPYNEMLITAKAAKDEYRPGDKVQVRLHAEPRHNNTAAAPIEFAVAVLDDAVFDLVTGGKAYFDPYKGLYHLDGLDIRNYNLILNLVGRQKFEKKGANPGGDGGADFKFRDVSKYVAYWNPSIKADKAGNASIDFVAPDNLTGWRVLALAVTPADKAGLGIGEFKVNRPTEIRPVMPNQILEGDQFVAGFSVMNRTEKPRDITVEIKAEGDLASNGEAASVKRVINLKPYARQTITLPLTAGMIPTKREIPEGAIGFKVTAGDALDKDGYAFTLPVHKGIDLVSATAYGATDKDDVVTPIAIPDGIRPDAGDLSVTLSPTVITDVAAAFRYIAQYPFLCWEQRLTKGVMAANFAVLKKYLPDDLQWSTAASTLASALKSAVDFQAPNGGMTYWVAANDRVDPYLSAYTALGFTWLRERGEEVPSTVSSKLDAYLLKLLRQDIAPDYYSDSMVASVRAVALAALSKTDQVSMRDIERLRPEYGSMGLFGNALLMQAAIAQNSQEGNKVARELLDLILAHSNQTSGKFLFSESRGAGYMRMLSTPLRDNCAILSSFAAYENLPGQREYVEETAFKLVRAISQSQREEGYWGNTQENMFCANALADYASAFETVDPNYTITATFDNQVMGEATLKGVQAKPVTLVHEIAEQDIGKSADVTLKREGEGRFYYATRLTYAPTSGITEPVNSGIEIRREYSVERDGKRVLLGNEAAIKRGELVRVDIYLSLPTARNFVVVNDPVPGGLEPVNRDLATTSEVDAAKGDYDRPEGSWGEKFKDWMEYASGYWSFYHRELRDESVRFYSDYLGAGNYHLSYVAQAIATGEFAQRAVKAEEMYDPDIFGYGHAGRLTIED